MKITIEHEGNIVVINTLDADIDLISTDAINFNGKKFHIERGSSISALYYSCLVTIWDLYQSATRGKNPKTGKGIELDYYIKGEKE